MALPQKKHLQAVPQESSGNPAIDKLTALETEIKGLRQDIVKVQKRLWLDIGSGVIAGLFVASCFLSLLGFTLMEINKANQEKVLKERTDKLIEQSRQREQELCQKYPELAAGCTE